MISERVQQVLMAQEEEDRSSLQNDLEKVIKKQFSNPEKVLACLKSGDGQELYETFCLEKSIVRTAPEFNIRKHTAAVMPYYHSHDFYEFIFVYRGFCRQYFGDNDTPVILQEGDCCLLTPGTIHEMFPSESDFVVLKATIPFRMFGEVMKSFPTQEKFIRELHSEDKSFLFYATGYEGIEMRSLVVRIVEEFYFGDSYKMAAISSYLALLFLSLARSKRETVNQGFIQQVTHWIRENLSEASAGGLAAYLGYSPRHMERMLREKTGATFTDILQRIRIEEAAKLLAGSTEKIDRISEMVGYQTTSGFYKRFYEVFKMTPNQYRKLYDT